MVQNYKPEDRWYQLMVSITKENKMLKSALKALAVKNDSTLSKQVSIILKQYLKKRGLL